jgi:hypothetical protein
MPARPLIVECGVPHTPPMSTRGRRDGRIQVVLVLTGMGLLAAVAAVTRDDLLDLVQMVGVLAAIIYGMTSGGPRPVRRSDGAGEIPPQYRFTVVVAGIFVIVANFSHDSGSRWAVGALATCGLSLAIHLGLLISRRPRLELRPDAVRVVEPWGSYLIPWVGLVRRSPLIVALPRTSLDGDELGLLVRHYYEEPDRRAEIATEAGYEHLTAVVARIDLLRTQFRYIDRPGARGLADQP